MRKERKAAVHQRLVHLWRRCGYVWRNSTLLCQTCIMHSKGIVLFTRLSNYDGIIYTTRLHNMHRNRPQAAYIFNPSMTALGCPLVKPVVNTGRTQRILTAVLSVWKRCVPTSHTEETTFTANVKLRYNCRIINCKPFKVKAPFLHTTKLFFKTTVLCPTAEFKCTSNNSFPSFWWNEKAPFRRIKASIQLEK